MSSSCPRVLQHGKLPLPQLEDEPRPRPALLTLENVLPAPHVAGGTHETRRAMADLVLRKLASFLATGRPEAEVPGSAANDLAALTTRQPA